MERFRTAFNPSGLLSPAKLLPTAEAVAWNKRTLDGVRLCNCIRAFTLAGQLLTYPNATASPPYRATANRAEVVSLIKAAAAERTPVFPLGVKRPWIQACPRVLLELPESWSIRSANRLPSSRYDGHRRSRDEDEKLRQILARESQELPVDVPQSHQATIGGCIAANISGYRRLGNGTLRDYVIGIEAVDGHGTVYHGGGRVVKNVAGYDFCRLLIGSQGTLGVITQVTLKVKPHAPRTAVLLLPCPDLSIADRCVEAVLQAPQLPSGLELFSKLPNSLNNISVADNSHDPIWLAVILHGTDSEVNAQLNSIVSNSLESAPYRMFSAASKAKNCCNICKNFQHCSRLVKAWPSNCTSSPVTCHGGLIG